MAQFTSYDAIGIKEQVDDLITNLSPTKTPFQASIGGDKTTQKIFDWQEDSLRAVQDNNQQEGFTASDVALVPTVMRENVTQILSETIKVSGSMDASDTYGRAKESAYQTSKSMSQVKRDFENALVGTAQAKVKPTDNTTNRKMAGFQRQLLNDGSNAMATTNTVIYTGSTSTTPSETNVLDVLQGLYNNGAEPSVIQVTPANSRVVADFAKASGRYRTLDNAAGDKNTTIINVVDVYVSPFGTQKVMLNRFLKAKNTLIYDPDMWKKVSFRPWFRETLAKTGDNSMSMIVGEYSLKHKAFLASGAVVEAVAGANVY
jgi:hypothetical protein